MVKPSFADRKKFDRDLSRGEGGELLIDMLQSRKQVEIKSDFLTTATGNLFIEYEDHDGKPTCLSVTEAAWWCHIVFQTETRPVAVFWFRVSHMRHWLPTMNLRLGKGGDSGKCTGYLLPMCKVQKLTLPIPNEIQA